MVARLQVAALDHNYSVDRQQAPTKEGVLRFKQEFSKAARAFVVKPIKEEKTWCFRSELQHGIVDRCANGPSQRTLLSAQRERVVVTLGERAGVPKMEKEQAIQQRIQRYTHP
ncbi:hypothetical protein J4Q44_G00313890 [Coregonus suidteri]|uniref:Uncharacterized protein n=1 Tax=Coregonus suidteri TaxID=861788 RepID=A0AAN8KZX1_9TELE